MELDWKSLGFQYLPTNGYVESNYENGSWSAPKFVASQTMEMHVAANVLHYGQACFEGLKAFAHKSGKTFIFRPDKNWERLTRSAQRICMVSPPEELFLESCKICIENNQEYIPPYGTGASLYLRPLLIGTQPTIGLNPSNSYKFLMMVTPVGPYYKTGFLPVKSLIIEDFDRAAPGGTGQAKVAGNYAAGLLPGIHARDKGYPIALFTDAKEHKYIDEFGTSNFVGLTSDKKYITPDSPSILKSITNLTLQEIAVDEGFSIENRPIAIEELDQFEEVGACGTAAIITPIYSIRRGDKEWTFGKPDQAGKYLSLLYEKLQGIQYGEIPDSKGWLFPAI